MENVKYKICYWYAEWEDMGARVPTCNYYKRYGECPCKPECEHFITKSEVDDIVRNMGKSGQMSDLISREDALKPFCIAPDGTRIPEVDCDNFPVEFSVEFIKKHLLSLPPAEPRGNLISREDAMEAFGLSEKTRKYGGDHSGYDTIMKYEIQDVLENLPPAEAEDRLYIKIYADDEPSVKAEKLYQICGETQKREVAEWLKEYFPSIDVDWIPVSEQLPNTTEQVLISVCDDHGDKPYYYTCVGWKCEKYWISDNDYVFGAVTAWEPLPEPYKGE